MLIIPMWQPHASAVAIGIKKIETRGFRTNYRGPVAIHAAKKWDKETKAITNALPQFVKDKLNDFWCSGLGWNFPFGEIIAVASLTDCLSTNLLPNMGHTPEILEAVFIRHPELDTPLERALGNYEEGRYGWVLTNVRQLANPIPYKAHQGVYEVGPEIAGRIWDEVHA